MTVALLAQAESLRCRLSNLPEFIPKLQASLIEEDQRHVLGCILIRLRTHFRHLTVAGSVRNEAEYLAWAARNLLELAVWAKFATASLQNAKRIQDDYVIDLAEMQEPVLRLVGKFEPAHPKREALEQQGEWLPRTKAEMGLPRDSKHLKTGALAREVGMAGEYFALNQVLSKVVHPTSFSILLSLPAEVSEELRSSFFGIGVGATEDALRYLLDYFEAAWLDCGLLRV